MLPSSTVFVDLTSEAEESNLLPTNSNEVTVRIGITRVE